MFDIGKRIKDRRIELGLSAEDLAPLVGLSPATIYRYENGDIKKVNTTKLQPFARALKTTEAYLMGWSADSADMDLQLYSTGKSFSEEAMSFAAKFDKLSEYGKEMIRCIFENEARYKVVKSVPHYGTAYQDGRVETKYAAKQEQKEMLEDLVEIKE